MTKFHIFTLLLVVALAFLPLQADMHARCYNPPDFSHYTAVTPSQLATTTRTHVKVSGLVAVTTHEADGDTHIAITDGKTTIVAECIPEIPCGIVAKGDKITVWGNSRYDKQHQWWEVHPVRLLETKP